VCQPPLPSREQRLKSLGCPLSVVRHTGVLLKRMARTVFVISAIDLVMVARGCDYETSKKIIFHIFKDYYKMEAEALTM
jgi:hypothetical protein